MMWSILSELLDSEGSDSMKSIEDYMEFRIKNKNAKQMADVGQIIVLTDGLRIT